MSDRVFIMSLGCDKDRVDAEIMAAKLSAEGFTLVEDIRDCDCAIINTCGFIESAKKESIDAIFEAAGFKDTGELKGILVTGCLSHRYIDEIADEIPEADGFLALGGNADICNAVRKVLSGSKVKISSGDLPMSGDRILSTPGHYAYVKIAEGCNNRCSYCAIPLIRGKYRSRTMDDIEAEVRKLVGGGVREIILVAQDTSAYGIDLKDGTNLAKLLTRLTAIDGIWKIRLLYTYIDRITDELLAVMARSDKIAKYLDMPLQHCSESILRRMRRYGSRDILKARIEDIREKVPGVALRSTFMVGFPGETDEQFEELCDFLREMKFERAGFFAFSPEEGTPAAGYEDQIDEDIKQERLSIIQTNQADIMFGLEKAKEGCEFEAVCDGFDQEKLMYVLRSEYDTPEVDTVIYALGGEKELMPGDIVRVKIISSDGEDLYGEF